MDTHSPTTNQDPTLTVMDFANPMQAKGKKTLKQRVSGWFKRHWSELFHGSSSTEPEDMYLYQQCLVTDLASFVIVWKK